MKSVKLSHLPTNSSLVWKLKYIITIDWWWIVRFDEARALQHRPKPIMSSTFIKSLINSPKFHTIQLRKSEFSGQWGKQSSRRSSSQEKNGKLLVSYEKMHNVFINIDRCRIRLGPATIDHPKKGFLVQHEHFINNRSRALTGNMHFSSLAWLIHQYKRYLSRWSWALTWVFNYVNFSKYIFDAFHPSAIVHDRLSTVNENIVNTRVIRGEHKTTTISFRDEKWMFDGLKRFSIQKNKTFLISRLPRSVGKLTSFLELRRNPWFWFGSYQNVTSRASSTFQSFDLNSVRHH